MKSQAQSNVTAVQVQAGDAVLAGDRAVPEEAVGIVVFAHGSGSSRHSPRNRFVAGHLNGRGLATLLLDLLTEREDAEDQYTRAWRFDIPLLARRLELAVESVTSAPATRDLPVGLFGSSTGAAAALIAAADQPGSVRAVVSRGGRPDLAAEALGEVRCPTLLIVGGNDEGVIELNRQAMERMGCEKRLEIVPDATHLFEEPGALEAVADLAAEWFRQKLS
ncbi:MAG TPA: dienelactone hydrolase family protein [Phycisphaerae bacterium]|nr:dienelactone hydrolase family protein [Phycisphaerae bacterium]